jgi:hydrogenase maturation protease
MPARVLVACIGNIFLGDDGFGVEVARRLRQRPLPEGVSVVDFGIRSYDLAYALMEPWRLAVLVDALPRGGEPGTVYVLEPELPEDGEAPASLDAHTMNPVSVLQMVGALGGKVGRMLVVGCEPETLEPDAHGNIGLSEAVSPAVDEAVRIVEELITRARSEATAA